MNPENNNQQIEEHHAALDKVHHSSHRLGLITIILIFGLFGIWSVVAKISTTITAQGKVITQSYNKTVMHPRGGIVRAIYVKEGDTVKKDDPLLALDSMTEELEKNSNTLQYDNNLFSICRLTAEIYRDKPMDCSRLKEKMLEIDRFDVLDKNAHETYMSNTKVIDNKVRLLQSNNDVLRQKNRGLEEQVSANEKLYESYKKELKKWKKLLKADAVDEMKAIEIERRMVQTKAQIASLRSQIDENLATVKSNENQIELEKTTFANSALKERKKLKSDNDIIHNKIMSLAHTIDNAVIKAPSEGRITDMKIHAVGEVVSPQRPIMSIVPNDKELMIEAYVLPMDIERVYQGQKAEISFPAFVDPSALPVYGEITYVSADVITPENQKESFYTILIKITPDGMKAIEANQFKIIPGMPASAFVRTGKQTFMEYLMQPLIQMFKGIYHAN